MPLQPQSDDPVIMTVNGQPVLRSEFEYSYNKNNSEGVIDKKTVDEYVDLFINYKLKVAAALDAKYDTLTSFKNEFAQYRDQQVLPAMVTDDDMMQEAHNIYDNTVKQIGPDGLVQTAHILLRVDQKASSDEHKAAKVRIDSIYNALKQGADFAEMAKKVSQDPGSARQGGLLPFVQRGQLVKEFEDVAFSLKDGEMSGIVETPYGYHIILRKEHKMLEPFEEHRENILKFMSRGKPSATSSWTRVSASTAATPLKSAPSGARPTISPAPMVQRYSPVERPRPLPRSPSVPSLT